MFELEREEKVCINGNTIFSKSKLLAIKTEAFSSTTIKYDTACTMAIPIDFHVFRT